MQYIGSGKAKRAAGIQALGALLATIKPYTSSFTAKGRSAEPPFVANDWYRMKPTAQQQGEFWVHTLLGR